VDTAREKLLARGVRGVGAASQFLDIGYLTHLTDPAGNANITLCPDTDLKSITSLSGCQVET
jgi:hypothetical protein